MTAYVDIVEDSFISAISHLSLCMKFGLFLNWKRQCMHGYCLTFPSDTKLQR